MKVYRDENVMFPVSNVSLIVLHAKPVSFQLTNGETITTPYVKVNLKDELFAGIPVADAEAGRKKMEEIQRLMEES
jgi:hypothetical protein